MPPLDQPAPDLYLLVVAHPDDESMFFGPTIHNLLQQHHAQQSAAPIHILSLSNGNYDGLGKVREIELRRAAAVLGVASLSHDQRDAVTCLDVKEMQDGPKAVWEAGDVANAVWNRISNLLGQGGQSNDSNAEKKKALRSVAVITFDERGVSGHPNHVDVCKGVRHMLKSRSGSQNIGGLNASISGWELISITNPLTKYCPPIEWIPMLLAYCLSLLSSFFGLGGSATNGRDNFSAQSLCSDESTSRDLVWTCRIFQPILIWRAMAAHQSQFVWYRRLSVLFSRYTYSNTLQRISTAPEAPILNDVRCDSGRDASNSVTNFHQ